MFSSDMSEILYDKSASILIFVKIVPGKGERLLRVQMKLHLRLHRES